MPRATLVVVAEAVLRADVAHSVLAAERDRPGVAVWHRVARDGCTAQLLLEATDLALAYKPAHTTTTDSPLATVPTWVEDLVASGKGASPDADRRTLLLLRNLLGLTPGGGKAVGASGFCSRSCATHANIALAVFQAAVCTRLWLRRPRRFEAGSLCCNNA